MTNARSNCAYGMFAALVRMSGRGAVVLAIASVNLAQAGDQLPADLLPSQFLLKYDAGAIVSLHGTDDHFDTEYIQEGGRLGDVVIRYRHVGGSWQTFDSAEVSSREQPSDSTSTSGGNCHISYAIPNRETTLLELTVRFEVEASNVRWILELRNVANELLEIGDFALPLPMNSLFRRGRPATSAVLKHSFISGDGSFLFWMRSNSVGPFLTMTPRENTHLEYWDVPPRIEPDELPASQQQPASRRRQEFRVYIHSLAAGADAKAHGCNWRQPHTSLTLAPAGQPGDHCTYGFNLQWANDYDGVRQILVDDGLVDVQVVPGMTVPADLFARVALRSKQSITSVDAEYADDTTIQPAGRRGDYQLYDVRFARLGENRLTVRFGEDRHIYLEFFATEPVETLIKKRAAFIARCQHRDPTKWYDGLISDWNMESQVLLGPDNYDRISGFRIYAVTCDDPGLCKPAYLAAKNAEYPAQSEVEALDYYIKHFVWGGLQQTTAEPYPYAVYGIQDWKRNRDSVDPGRNGQRHVWRCYDYPHVVLMYFSMYRVAKNFPHIHTALDAREYLTRAFGTARAMFTVPLEIEKWSAYTTGFYNELVLVDLIKELDAAGMHAEADELRRHWEKKVMYFASGKADLFESEYPFDSTGFESTHALAKYAVEHAGRPGSPDGGVNLDNAQQFMEAQIKANIFCRGSVEPAYYYLGSDYRAGGGNAYTLSYMSQMGGWSILDYGLNFARAPSPYLRLGYASYLSAWALMNTGTPQSEYGYWYPGPENDGGAGGGFEPAPYGQTWLGQPHHRGAWYYASEIDLGYCGALRTAATILADDPIFGRFCFGGDWRTTPDGIEIYPKDGLRRRFHALLNGAKIHLTLDSDRFQNSHPLVLDEGLSTVRFALESDNLAEHTALLTVSGLASGKYTVRIGAEQLAVWDAGVTQTAIVRIPMLPGGRSQPVVLMKNL